MTCWGRRSAIGRSQAVFLLLACCYQEGASGSPHARSPGNWVGRRRVSFRWPAMIGNLAWLTSHREPRRAKGYSCGIPVSSSGMRDRAKPRNRQPVEPSTPRRAAFPPMDGVDCESNGRCARRSPSVTLLPTRSGDQIGDRRTGGQHGIIRGPILDLVVENPLRDGRNSDRAAGGARCAGWILRGEIKRLVSGGHRAGGRGRNAGVVASCAVDELRRSILLITELDDRVIHAEPGWRLYRNDHRHKGPTIHQIPGRIRQHLCHPHFRSLVVQPLLAIQNPGVVGQERVVLEAVDHTQPRSGAHKSASGSPEVVRRLIERELDNRVCRVPYIPDANVIPCTQRTSAMDAAASACGRDDAWTIDVDLSHRAPRIEFPGRPHNTVGVRSCRARADTGTGPAHVDQRMRSATRTRSHQLAVDRHASRRAIDPRSRIAKRVIDIYWSRGRSRFVKLSCYQGVSRFVLAPLNWNIVECADGLVGRGICARWVWMVASIESPRVAKDSGERRFCSHVIDASGLIWRGVRKGHTEHAGHIAYLRLVSKRPPPNRLAPVWQGGG